MASDRKQVIVRMPIDLYADLKRQAEIEDRSVAAAVRNAIRLYLGHAMDYYDPDH